jgi:TonB family protein
VLIEFQINRHGRAVSEKLVAAEADPVLQASALKFVEAAKFDVSEPGIDLADPTPFRVTVLYCLPQCANVVPFPGTEAITVSGSPIPKSPSDY